MDPRPAPATGSRRVSLGKADAERLLAMVDDDGALIALLTDVLGRLVGDLPPTGWHGLVRIASERAGWPRSRSEALVEPGEDGHRERVRLALDLAELRRLG